MFSPLALSITELLEFPCMNLEKGCQVKLKKKEILEHEREECIYTEKLQCQGCEEMIAVFVLPEHFKDCGYLSYKSVNLSLEMNKSVKVYGRFDAFSSLVPIVYKLKNSKNWFILVGKDVGYKRVFYVQHFCGEEKKETFNFELKISGGSEAIFRSLTAKCTPMGVMNAMKMGNTLEVSKVAMEEMCLVEKPEAKRYMLYAEFKVMPSL